MVDPSELDGGLEPIAQMVDYYAREMGQLAGHLMAALSLLVDLEDSYGWDSQSAQARETVRYARLLVASVLRVVATGQAERGDELGMAEAIDDALQRLFGQRNGGHGQ